MIEIIERDLKYPIWERDIRYQDYCDTKLYMGRAKRERGKG